MHSQRSDVSAVSPSSSRRGTKEHFDPQTALDPHRRTELTRFRVFARVRPFITEELEALPPETPLRSVIEMIGEKTILLDPKDNWAPFREFEFDASLWSIPNSQPLVTTFADVRRDTWESQRDVYEKIAMGCVEDAFDGFNSCILTYGQTGSGKTYTMMGKYDPTESIVDGEEGVIPRMCNDLFKLLDERKREEEASTCDKRRTYTVVVSFVEIYMEKARDLLDPSIKHNRLTKEAIMSDARVRHDPQSGPYIEGVSRYEVHNWQQCCSLLERGSQHRTTCATLVHQQSSRSHAIFQMTLLEEEIQKPNDRFSPPVRSVRGARINLVDLAGSERGGTTNYVKESSNINKSLLALRRVIDNLTERQNRQLELARALAQGLPTPAQVALPQVPFRDSVLTLLLSDSIGGNARTTMVATLSPLDKNFGDTLATLTWSSKARNLVTVVKSNDPQSTVREDLASRASALQSGLLIQRQNIDGLRQALIDRKESAEEYQRESRKVMKQIVTTNSEIIQTEQHVAAAKIQRAMVPFLRRRRMEVLQREVQEAQDDLTVANEAYSAQRKSFTSINDVIQSQTAEVHEQQEKEVRLKEECRKRQDTAAQKQRLQVAEQAHEMAMRSVRETLEPIERETATVRAQCTQKDSERVSLQESIATFKQQEHQNAEFKKNCPEQGYGTILRDLQLREAELKKQVESLTKERDKLLKKARKA